MIDFKICEQACCSVQIIDLTPVIGGYNKSKSYYPQNNPTLGFRSSDVVAIYTLTKIKSDGYEVIHSHFVDDVEQDMDMTFPEDGYFKLTKTVIPTQNILYTDFIDYDEENDIRVWENYGKTFYFFDTYRKKLFKVLKDDPKIALSGTLLYLDEKTNEYKHTDNNRCITNLVVDADDTELINKTILTEKEHSFVKETESGYVLCEEDDEDMSGYLYDINDLTFEWIYDNVCIRHNKTDKVNEFNYPVIKGYSYVEVCDLMEILEQCDGIITTQRNTKDLFSICKFRECVFKLTSEYVKNCPTKCGSGNTDADLIWLQSSLWTLEFLIECGDYMEAQIILEQLSVCGGPCMSIDLKKKKGCNCGKRL